MARQTCHRTARSDIEERKLNRLLFGREIAREVFGNQALKVLRGKARRRIVAVFVHERVLVDGKLRSADRCISGVGPRQSDLADHIVRRMKKGLIDRSQLPTELTEVPPRLLERIVRKLEKELVLDQLNVVCGGQEPEVSYDHGESCWRVTESAVDVWRQGADRSKERFDGKRRVLQGRLVARIA